MLDKKLPEITLVLKDLKALHMSYMPFIYGGGFFVKTDAIYHLEDRVHLNVEILDELTPYQFTAQVVWITPKGAQGNKVMGIGLQLPEDESKVLVSKIETYLAGLLNTAQMTDTL